MSSIYLPELGTIAEWAVAIATFLLALVAAFQDWVRRWFWKPHLRLQARVAQPDCHKTTWNHPLVRQTPQGEVVTEVLHIPCYYFRLRVTNEGPAEARDVELFAKALRRRRADGMFENVDRFTPMNLCWAHFQPRAIVLSVLSAHMPKRCDLAHVFHPNYATHIGHVLPGVAQGTPLLAFDLQAEPTMKGHLVEPGTYQLDLVLAASNFSPKDYMLEIQFPGDWIDGEARMLRDGFGMRLI